MRNVLRKTLRGVSPVLNSHGRATNVICRLFSISLHFFCEQPVKEVVVQIGGPYKFYASCDRFHLTYGPNWNAGNHLCSGVATSAFKEQLTNGTDELNQCQNNDDLWICLIYTSFWLMFLKYWTCMFMNSPVFDSALCTDETISLLQASVQMSVLPPVLPHCGDIHSYLISCLS